MTMSNTASLLLLVVALSAALASASIEREPVKVTNRNSGPKYDIDEVERTRVAAEQAESPRVPFARPQFEGSDRAPEDDEPVGHISIRRIFLVPVGPSDGSNSMWANGRHPAWTAPRQGDSGEESAERPSMFAGQTKPFWPFLMPSVPAPAADAPRPHLLGGDEASRSPTGEQPSPSATSEREDGSPDQRRPMIDPIQLMLDLMHQALNSASQSGLINDLSKGAQAGNNNNNTDAIKPSSSEPSRVGATGDLERPIKPTSTNETKEDIVEIEGKKYLRKAIINKHVGENIVFVTKRLIFIPLNETDSTVPASSPAAPSITDSPSETTVASVANEPTTTLQPTSAPVVTEKAEELPASPSEVSASSITQAATEPSTTVASAPEETTTGKESLVERVSETVERLAERLVDRVGTDFASSSTTTGKPSV